MTRTILPISALFAAALILSIVAVSDPVAAAPRERIEVLAQTERPSVPDAVSAVEPPTEHAESDSGAAVDADVDLPDEVVKVPVIEGAGGPHIGRHAAPHGGALVPLGEAVAHLEFVLDPATGLLTLHVLDAEASERLRLPQEMVFVLINANGEEFAIVLFSMEDSETGDRHGATSRFAASHRRLIDVHRFEAIVEGITISRQSFRRVRVSYPAGSE